MTCWPPNAANFQHTGSLSNLAAPLRNVKARAQRPFPAQTERHFTAPFSSSRPCAAASSSSSAASSYGSSSPGKRKGEGKTGLRSVAGIGPRNEERLMSKGIDSVDTLWEVFTAQKKRDEDKMLSFLQGDIGIRNRRHCIDIVKHIAELEPDAGLDSGAQLGQDARRRKNKVTLCVEGNISAGKSTFLQKLLKSSVELRDIIEVVPEPVDKWQSITDTNGGQPCNLLEAFYRNPERYAYTFQNYVFVTRLMQAKDSEDCTAPLRLLERSVFSDRMVFVRAVYEAKWLSEMELSIYDSWFDPVVSSLKGLVPDGFIYLHASPETCMRRMSLRGRGEEGGVTMDYLSNLHTKHEEWLRQGTLRPEELALLSDPSRNLTPPQQSGFAANPTVYYRTPEEPESVRGKIFYLNQSKQPLLRKHIDGLPALYLDCDEDIDLDKDSDAKESFARQIKDFSDHVRALREARSQASGLVLPTQDSMHPFLDRACPEMIKDHLLANPRRTFNTDHLQRQFAGV